jgi:hypothetical protein
MKKESKIPFWPGTYMVVAMPLSLPYEETVTSHFDMAKLEEQ